MDEAAAVAALRRAYAMGPFPAAEVTWLLYRTATRGCKRELMTRRRSEDPPTRGQQLRANAIRLRQLMADNQRIDVGAVYRVRSGIRRFRVRGLEPSASDLVVDIDADQLGERPCPCSAKELCNACWPLMCAAMKRAHDVLTRVYHLKVIVWSFSGRRGVHGWVLDWGTEEWSVEARRALVHQLHLRGVDVDDAVTTDLKHPIGLVGSVHNTTQRVCVTLDPNAPGGGYAWDELPRVADAVHNPAHLDATRARLRAAVQALRIWHAR
jgi:hypothetical protein